MELICQQVEKSVCRAGWCFLFWRSPHFFCWLFRSLTSSSGSLFTREIRCCKICTWHLCKSSESLTKLLCCCLKVPQSSRRVQSKFCKCMPHAECKNQILYKFVMQSGQYSLKDRECALISGESYHAGIIWILVTCKISSKSHAASFFISEVLFRKRRIVPCPNVGICWNLKNSSSI